MTRPRSFTIAAALMCLLSLTNIAIQLPNLTMGLAAETQYNGAGPPFFLVLLNFVTAAMGLVSTYWVWKVRSK